MHMMPQESLDTGNKERPCMSGSAQLSYYTLFVQLVRELCLA